MATINTDKLYLAMLIKDELDSLIFDTPEYVPGIQKFQAKVKTNTGENYAEGALADQDTTLQDIEITFDLRDFTSAQQAKWLGHHVAKEGGTFAKQDDSSPYVAMLYKYTKAGGKKGYKVYYKGKLVEPDDTVNQMEGKVNYQNPSVTATFQPLANNGMWKYGVEEGDANCPPNIATDFFASVIVPTEAENVAVTGVTLDSTSAAIAVNGTKQITATVAPTNATNKTVTWSSSDNTVATVSNTGLITGIKAGSATITATTVDGSKTATVSVTVSAS